MSVSSGGSVSDQDVNSDIGDFANLANDDNDNNSLASERGNNFSQQPNDSYRPSNNSYRPSNNGYNRESTPSELNKKRDYLVKLHDLKAKGVHLTGSYNMDTDINDLMLEYDRHTSTQKKNNSLAFSKRALMLAVQGMEMMSTTDPFGLNIDLEGWSDSVNPDEYSDILEELIEKYSGDSNTPPELRLVFGLATSAIAVHVGNTMFGNKKQRRTKMSRRLSSTSTIASVREPDFSNVMSMLNATPKPKPKTPNPRPKVSQPLPEPEPDSEPDEVILPQELNDRVVYSSDSSEEESESGPSSSESEDETQNQITIQEVAKTAAGKRPRGRPPGSGRGRGRGRGAAKASTRGRPSTKNTINI